MVESDIKARPDDLSTHERLSTVATRQMKHKDSKQALLTSGNHLVKLCMMTAAMRVLPSPVGRQTRVFCRSAVLMMSV